MRPIGLLPYAYRAWMVIRQCKEWSLRLHDGKHVGAAALAARTRPSIEIRHYEGEHSLLAILGSSECYESVGHCLVGQRALC